MKKSELVLSLWQRLLLLFFTFIICYMLTMVCSYLIGRVLSGNLPASLRISALVQDVVAFTLPAVITAVMVTRRPAQLLCITASPHLFVLLLIALVTAVSIPLQESIINWNQNIHLPESMAAFEKIARQMEDLANGSVLALVSDGSVSALILNILVIGVAAAFAEEIFFRGCLQRLLTTGGVNIHIAVWVVAFLFSAMHMQFFGFVPRMLLGAYFGYLLVWSKNLWVPITAHLLNNVMYVVIACRQFREGGVEAIANAESETWPWWAVVLSILATALCLYGIFRLGKTEEEQ